MFSYFLFPQCLIRYLLRGLPPVDSTLVSRTFHLPMIGSWYTSLCESIYLPDFAYWSQNSPFSCRITDIKLPTNFSTYLHVSTVEIRLRRLFLLQTTATGGPPTISNRYRYILGSHNPCHILIHHRRPRPVVRQARVRVDRWAPLKSSLVYVRWSDLYDRPLLTVFTVPHQILYMSSPIPMNHLLFKDAKSVHDHSGWSL